MALRSFEEVPGFAENFETMTRLSEGFRPELVVSDFESFAYLYAKKHDLPVLSIDNMQIINRCTHDAAILAGEETSFQFTRAFVKGKLPFCDRYLITTFFYPPLRKERTSLYPPILRPEILATKSRPGEHLLVYQTGEGYDAQFVSTVDGVIERLGAESFDLLLMDLNYSRDTTSGREGLALIPRVRDHDPALRR